MKHNTLTDRSGQLSPVNDEEITFKDILSKLIEWRNYLCSKWIIIIAAITIGGIGGFLYASSKEQKFKAELTFFLETERTTGVGGIGGIAGQLGIDIGNNGGGAFEGENLLELMQSRSMVQRALLKGINIGGRVVSLAQLYIDSNELPEAWTTEPQYKDIRFLPGEDPFRFSIYENTIMNYLHRKIISDNLVVDRKDKKSSIIVVQVLSPQEAFSKYFAESLVEQVSDFYVESKTKRSFNNVAVLKHQADSVRRALNSAISGVASSVDFNPNPNPARQVIQVPSQRRQIDVQANTVILQELIKNLEVAKVSLRKETPLIQVVDSPVLPLDIIKTSGLKYTVFGSFLVGALVILWLLLGHILREAMARG